MKYLLVALFLASIAGLEFFHVFATDDAQDRLACMAPQSKVEAIRERFLLHLHSH